MTPVPPVVRMASRIAVTTTIANSSTTRNRCAFERGCGGPLGVEIRRGTVAKLQTVRMNTHNGTVNTRSTKHVLMPFAFGFVRFVSSTTTMFAFEVRF